MKVRKSEVSRLVESIVAKTLNEDPELQMHARIALAIEDLTLKVKDEAEKNGITVDPKSLHAFAQDVAKHAVALIQVSRIRR